MRLALILVGFGHVGRRFVRLLGEMRGPLAAMGITPVIVGAITRRHGAIVDPAGLELRHLHEALEGPAAGEAASLPRLAAALDRLRPEAFEARVVVETTTLDVRSGEPAISHVRASLAAGAHVVTANKGPVAFAYRALEAEARAADRALLFEGAVMDGVPVFSLVRDTMPGLTIHGFRGVVNSTTNYLLTSMEQGENFDDALARMQAAGVAEADPRLDVDGWDAAAKAAALANVLLDAGITPLDVARQGVSAADAGRAREALARGRRLKLVARAEGRASSVRARVGLEALDTGDPLAMLDGQANAIEFDTWPLGRVVVTQRDGGLEKTAYALVADLVTVAKRVAARAGRS